MPRRLTCPYCYTAFPARRTMFRCTGRSGIDGRTCAPVPDERLERYTGIRTTVPPTFSRTLLDRPFRHRIRHRVCGAETAYRICPECHRQLPVRFGKVPSRLIALVGARDVGKTVYLTVLLREMRGRIGQAFNAAVSEADDDTRNRFKTDYEKPLYSERALPLPTPSATKNFDHVSPLVFEFSVDRPTRFGRSRTVSTLLSFFDSAGEDLISAESVDYHARYLRNADGIILLLDPLQFPEAGKLASPSVRRPPPNDQDHILQRVTELLHRSGSSVTAKITKRIAVVFSKIDTIEDALDESSPLRHDSTYRPGTGTGFDIADADEIGEEVRQLLNTWEDGGIDRYLHQHYRHHRYRYFGVTALGDEPADGRIPDLSVRPRRVADPLLWLLSEVGAVGTIRPTGKPR